MGLLWGARVFNYESANLSTEQISHDIAKILVQQGHLQKGDVFVTLLSVPAQQDLRTNTVKMGVIDKIADEVAAEQ
ncbi:Pyruvate kinase, alpha/beta [Corchorus olitorius]|uniref:Pyruvate kinase, alpha/beta n=1 Tax=Corchorus olitorius TaxID=93759 RepID=A0A1R3L0U8_9ROSI|nr:Pyruvate kinase, alpha/beta [Corchorus olitorius]